MVCYSIIRFIHQPVEVAFENLKINKLDIQNWSVNIDIQANKVNELVKASQMAA